MTGNLATRLKREVEHGASETAVRQAEFGWSSPAGLIRRQRRSEFLVHGIPRGSRVLEIGAGTGVQTIALLNAGLTVVGIDISPDLLAHAAIRAAEAEYVTMDAHQLRFPAASFDAVVGVSILHHLEWDQALAEAFRVLRPGGVVRFSEPNLLNPAIFLQKNIPWLKRLVGDSPDEYAFTPNQIRHSLRDAGFESIEAEPYEFLHPGTHTRLIRFISKLETLLLGTPLRLIGGSLLIKAVKPARSQNAT